MKDPNNDPTVRLFEYKGWFFQRVFDISLWRRGVFQGRSNIYLWHFMADKILVYLKWEFDVFAKWKQHTHGKKNAT